MFVFLGAGILIWLVRPPPRLGWRPRVMAGAPLLALSTRRRVPEPVLVLVAAALGVVLKLW